MTPDTLASSPALNEQQQLIVTQLAEFFPAQEIKHRILHKSQNGKKGKFHFYADPRAYTDRLNTCVTLAGWSRTYSVTTVGPVTRFRNTQAIQTGKILVTCTVTIHGLGTHSGTGEEWADDDNAMTSAEAQAFKRACSCFDLGRYFYDADAWADIDSYGNPKETLMIAAKFLPKERRAPLPAQAEAPQSQKQAPQPAPAPASQKKDAITKTQPADPAMTAWIERMRQPVGDRLYMKALELNHVRRAADLPNAAAQENVVQYLERVQRGLNKANDLADELGEQAFIDALDSQNLGTLMDCQSIEVLGAVVNHMLGQPLKKAA